MTDQDSSGFTVVDRRRAAQEKAASEPQPAETADESTRPTTPEASPAATTQAPSENGSPSDAAPPPSADGRESDNAESPSEPPGAESQAPPDPTLLLSLAAMQMDTRDFAQAVLGIFDVYAWQAMGLVANPISGEPQKDLPSAQLAIDCVQFLLSKLDSEFSEPERRDAQRRLNDLRMNYLAKLRES